MFELKATITVSCDTCGKFAEWESWSSSLEKVHSHVMESGPKGWLRTTSGGASQVETWKCDDCEMSELRAKILSEVEQ